MGRMIKLKPKTVMSDSAIERAKKRAKKKYQSYLDKNPIIEYSTTPLSDNKE